MDFYELKVSFGFVYIYVYIQYRAIIINYRRIKDKYFNITL